MVKSEVLRVNTTKFVLVLVLDIFFESSDGLGAQNFDGEGATVRVTPHPAIKNHHLWDDDDDDGGVSRS